MGRARALNLEGWTSLLSQNLLSIWAGFGIQELLSPLSNLSQEKGFGGVSLSPLLCLGKLVGNRG